MTTVSGATTPCLYGSLKSDSRAAGIIPFEEARPLIGKDLPREEKCVRGNLVYGLSQVEQDLLDVFEGDVSHLPEWPTVPNIDR